MPKFSSIRIRLLTLPLLLIVCFVGYFIFEAQQRWNASVEQRIESLSYVTEMGQPLAQQFVDKVKAGELSEEEAKATFIEEIEAIREVVPVY